MQILLWLYRNKGLLSSCSKWCMSFSTLCAMHSCHQHNFARDEANLGFVMPSMIIQLLKQRCLSCATDIPAFVSQSLKTVNFTDSPTMTRKYNFLEFWSADFIGCLWKCRFFPIHLEIHQYFLQSQFSICNRAIWIINIRNCTRLSAVLAIFS